MCRCDEYLLFSPHRNGCRPFVEIYIGEDRVLTTSQEYEKMRGFSVEEGKVTIPLNTQVSGDVTVAVYHARSTFGGKVQGKVKSYSFCCRQESTNDPEAGTGT